MSNTIHIFHQYKGVMWMTAVDMYLDTDTWHSSVLAMYLVILSGSGLSIHFTITLALSSLINWHLFTLNMAFHRVAVEVRTTRSGIVEVTVPTCTARRRGHSTARQVVVCVARTPLPAPLLSPHWTTVVATLVRGGRRHNPPPADSRPFHTPS